MIYWRRYTLTIVHDDLNAILCSMTNDCKLSQCLGSWGLFSDHSHHMSHDTELADYDLKRTQISLIRKYPRRVVMWLTCGFRVYSWLGVKVCSELGPGGYWDIVIVSHEITLSSAQWRGLWLGCELCRTGPWALTGSHHWDGPGLGPGHDPAHHTPPTPHTGDDTGTGKQSHTMLRLMDRKDWSETMSVSSSRIWVGLVTNGYDRHSLISDQALSCHGPTNWNLSAHVGRDTSTNGWSLSAEQNTMSSAEYCGTPCEYYPHWRMPASEGPGWGARTHSSLHSQSSLETLARPLSLTSISKLLSNICK